MPVKWLLGPKGEKVSFEEAPAWFEDRGIMPSYAVVAIIQGYADERPAFNVRPSDISPKFTCRRQRVWMATNEYGVNPLAEEAMLEGSALHEQLGAMEIEVPERYFSREVDANAEQVVYGDERLPVCGVPMRGRIDWLFPDRIEDLKTSTPFFITKYGAKGSGIKPWVDIWLPPEDDDVQNWRIQLSLYAVLLQKSGKDAPTRGRVWRRWSGVKADKVRWKKFDFDLLTEAGLEAAIGQWARDLHASLKEAEGGNVDAWKTTPADGREMVGSRGNMWRCEPCPLKTACFKLDDLAVW
jgi:hypothetical protein